MKNTALKLLSASIWLLSELAALLRLKSLAQRLDFLSIDIHPYTPNY